MAHVGDELGAQAFKPAEFGAVLEDEQEVRRADAVRERHHGAGGAVRCRACVQGEFRIGAPAALARGGDQGIEFRAARELYQ